MCNQNVIKHIKCEMKSTRSYWYAAAMHISKNNFSRKFSIFEFQRIAKNFEHLTLDCLKSVCG